MGLKLTFPLKILKKGGLKSIFFAGTLKKGGLKSIFFPNVLKKGVYTQSLPIIFTSPPGQSGHGMWDGRMDGGTEWNQYTPQQLRY